jgi:hypothetical protein
MGRKLARTVIVRDSAGGAVAFGPNDDVPEWAAKQITNPDAWAEQAHADETAAGPGEGMSEPQPSSQPEPPATSARKDEWIEYAVSQGMGRDEAETWTKDQLVTAFGRDD